MDPSNTLSEQNLFNESTRELCPKDCCVGLLSDSGICKVCGFSSQNTEQNEPSSLLQITVSSASDYLDEDDWTARELCSKENCVGLVNSLGHCKECGSAG